MDTSGSSTGLEVAVPELLFKMLGAMESWMKI